MRVESNLSGRPEKTTGMVNWKPDGSRSKDNSLLFGARIAGVASSPLPKEDNG